MIELRGAGKTCRNGNGVLGVSLRLESGLTGLGGRAVQARPQMTSCSIASSTAALEIAGQGQEAPP